MTMTLDPASILSSVTTIARAITGIRIAYDFDEWPDSPSGLFKKDGAVHLTGVPGEDGTGWRYASGGSDMAIWTLEVPLYTVVNDAATANRTRAWALPYVARYPEAFRASVKLGGTVSSVGFDADARIVRSIPEWPGWDGCYIVRHVLTVTVKGVVANAA